MSWCSCRQMVCYETTTYYRIFLQPLFLLPTPPPRKIPGPQAQILDLPLGCLCEQWEEWNIGVGRVRTLAGEEDLTRGQEECGDNKLAFNRKSWDQIHYFAPWGISSMGRNRSVVVTCVCLLFVFCSEDILSWWHLLRHLSVNSYEGPGFLRQGLDTICHNASTGHCHSKGENI